MTFDHDLHAEILDSLKDVSFNPPEGAEDVAGAFDALQACFALGEWELCRELVGILRDNVDDRNVLLDLSIRAAQLDAVEKGLDQALETLQKLAPDILSQGPGIYENRKAVLHYLADDAEGFVKGMQAAAAASDNNPMMLADLAQAEARFGSLEKARIIGRQSLGCSGFADAAKRLSLARCKW